MRVVAALAVLLWAVAPAGVAGGQTAGGAAQGAALAVAPVMLVVDTSGSMGDEDTNNGGTKIEGAKLALLDYLGSVDEEAFVGLRTYPAAAGGCDSGLRRIGIGKVDPERMSETIRGLEPAGDTPTAEAMRAAVQDFSSAGYDRGTLVLVSDGESTCDNPCEAAKEIKGRGFDLDAITVGFRISEAGREQLECIANALDGRYLDVEEGDELRSTLDALGRPKLEVVLGSPGPLRAVGGGDYIDVQATLTNRGDIDASGVVAQFTSDEAGVDVRRPVTHLGNLEPTGSRTINWRVRADVRLIGKTPDFTVVVRALNADRSATVDGEIFVEGIDRAQDAGDILKKPGRIAILGDSFSAGEGADIYDPKTDSDSNGCHRSPTLTYIATAYKNDTTVLACSGALTHHIDAPGDFGMRSQILQLAELQGAGTNTLRPARAVAMTLGGNDAGFPGLAASCILALESCTKTILPAIPFKPWERHSRFEWEKDALKAQRKADLVKAYKVVHETLNRRAMYEKRGGAAPILVMAYPLPIPLSGRSCAPMGFWTLPQGVISKDFKLQAPLRTHYWVDNDEIFFLAGFTIKLNGIVESAVRQARIEGVPVFYIPPTEMAFQPRHTLCDSGLGDSATTPWARGLASFNFGGLNLDQVAKLVAPGDAPWKTPAVRTALFGKTAADRGKQEIAHPNAKGYLAETSAILRWSRSTAADNALEFLRTVGPQDGAPTSWRASDVDLGQLRPGTSINLQGGTTYPVTLGGLAPGSPLHLEVRSTPRLLGEATADTNGRVATRVAVPRDLEDGGHHLVLSGTDPNGQPKVVRIAFHYDAPYRPTFIQATAGSSAIALMLGLLALGLSALLSRWADRRDSA